MKLILDAMGGDKGPGEFVKAAVEGSKKYNCEVILVGNEEILREEAEKQKLDISTIEIVHASDVITMEANGLARVGNSGSGADYCLCNTGNGLVLTDNAAVENGVKIQDLLSLALHELRNGNSRPAGNDLCDLFFGNRVANQGGSRSFLFAYLFCLFKSGFQSRELGVAKTGGFFVFVVSLGGFYVAVYAVDLRF